MTKQEAVARVAAHAAGWLQSGDFEEATGVNPDSVSNADVERLGEAVAEVVSRLHRMGKQS